MSSLSGLITSGFLIDEFIETTWLAVASRRGTPSSLSSSALKQLEKRKKEPKIYDVVFSLK